MITPGELGVDAQGPFDINCVYSFFYKRSYRGIQDDFLLKNTKHFILQMFSQTRQLLQDRSVLVRYGPAPHGKEQKKLSLSRDLYKQSHQKNLDLLGARNNLSPYRTNLEKNELLSSPARMRIRQDEKEMILEAIYQRKKDLLVKITALGSNFPRYEAKTTRRLMMSFNLTDFLIK